MQLFRIAQLNYPIFSGFGAAKYGGRWNSAGRPLIYTATSLAGAKLELLAQGGAMDLMPTGYGYVVITVPTQIETKKFPRANPPRQVIESQRYGDEWADSLITALLFVPSAASPGDWNALINPEHPDFKSLVVGKERKVIWDKRHFRA